jgi:type IV pilus assembly protein PilM
MGSMKNTLFYKDKPLFGLDIGYNSIKVMELATHGKHTSVAGYGVIGFDEKAMKDGVITQPEVLAQAAYELFDKHIIGKIGTRRVAAAIPAARAYTRLMTLPSNLGRKQLDEAVRFEAEQYIPMSLDDLYLDYTKHAVHGENTEVLVVAVPKKIVDSYMAFLKLIGLEACTLETSILAAARLIGETDSSRGLPTVLIDFGSISVDLTVYDHVPIVNGTVLGGGDDFTKRIAERLGVTPQEAHTIKTKYGLSLSKRQREITEALDPILQELIKEIRRIVRYYDERAENKTKIEQIITMGGGAHMPGLNDYLTDHLRMPTRRCEPWSTIKFDHLQPPNDVEKSMYVTSAGLGLIHPREIWK